MRINIIGPCAAGKTTLSLKIGRVLNYEVVDLDILYVDHKGTTKSDVKHNSCDWVVNNLSETLKQKDWIMEGIFPIKKVLKKADMILYLNTPFLVSLYRQWKRFFTDPYQQEKFGFINNIILSWIIIKQHYANGSYYRLGDFRYPTKKYYSRLMEKYKKKAIVMEGELNAEKIADLDFILKNAGIIKTN